MTRANVACAAAFGLVLVFGVAVALRHFPDATMYHMTADEGAYYNQAVTIRAEGLRGFRRLAREYIGSADLQALPAPNRVGHILLASMAVRIGGSIKALSVLSLACFVATTIAVFLFTWRYWDPLTAAIAGGLAALSPLGLGLARRALMDSDAALFAIVALLLFVHWLSTDRRPALVGFAVTLGAALIVKETNWLFVPFFIAAAIVVRWRERRSIPWKAIALIGIAVPLAAAAATAALLGVDDFVQIARISSRLNAVSPNAYLAAYGSGPWYEYFISLLLLSPVVTLMFLLGAGGAVVATRRHLPSMLLLAFFVYAIAALTWLPKNPRLILPLDAVARISAASLIVLLVERARAISRRLALVTAGGLVAAALASDVSAFDRYFAQLDVYDPVTFVLLERSRMTPPSANWGGEKMADEYLELSVAYYRARDFHSAIRAARTALLWRPNDAAAFNNIGSAFCELAQWGDAVAALQQALRIDPRSELAKNNLAWATRELEKAGRKE